MRKREVATRLQRPSQCGNWKAKNMLDQTNLNQIIESNTYLITAGHTLSFMVFVTTTVMSIRGQKQWENTELKWK